MKQQRIHPVVSGLVIAGALVLVIGAVSIAVRADILFPLLGSREPSVFGAYDESENYDAVRSVREGFVLRYPTPLVGKLIDGRVWVQSTESTYDFKPGTTFDGDHLAALKAEGFVHQNQNKSLEERLIDLDISFTGLTESSDVQLKNNYKLYTGTRTDQKDPRIMASYVIPVGQRIFVFDLFATTRDEYNKQRDALLTTLSTFMVLENPAMSDFHHYYNEERYFQFDVRNDFVVHAEDGVKGTVRLGSLHDGMIIEVSAPQDDASLEELGAAFTSEPSTDVESSLYKGKRWTKVASDGSEEELTVLPTSRGNFSLRTKIVKDEVGLWNFEKTRLLNSFKVQDVVALDGWTRTEDRDLKMVVWTPVEPKKETDGYNFSVPNHDQYTIRVLSYVNPNLSIEQWIDRRDLNNYKGASWKYMTVKEFTQYNDRRTLRAIDPVGAAVHRDFYVASNSRMYIVSLSPYEPGLPPEVEAVQNTIIEHLEIKK